MYVYNDPVVNVVHDGDGDGDDAVERMGVQFGGCVVVGGFVVVSM